MVHADSFSVTGLEVLSMQGPATIIVTIKDPSLWYLLGDFCHYIERGSVDVCLQTGGHVHPFIIGVKYERSRRDAGHQRKKVRVWYNL